MVDSGINFFVKPPSFVYYYFITDILQVVILSLFNPFISNTGRIQPRGFSIDV